MKVYLNRALAPDTLLGHVELDGRVYESRSGPDRHVGHVDLQNGKVYISRLGPDTYLGWVDLRTGKVFVYRPVAPDEYVGEVKPDGRMYHHALAPDEYVAEIKEGSPSIAHLGGAYLLLVLARVEEKEAKKAEEEESKNAPDSKLAGNAT